MSGWIKLHRKTLHWEWYTDANTMRLFMHLLITVNYEPKKWRGIDISRGQIITSSEKLASQIGLTRQQIRTSLDKLQSTNDITIKTTNRSSLVTLVMYDSYQSGEETVTNKTPSKQQTSNQPDNQQVTSPITTTKEVKNLRSKEVKNTTAEDVSMEDAIIAGLNIRAETNYRYIDTNRRLITARLKDYSYDDVMSVIKKKCEEWKGGAMEKYLRPSTLFNATKFDEYFNQKIQSSGVDNGQNRSRQNIKETALERMEREQIAMDLRRQAPQDNGEVFSQDGTIVPPQIHIS